MTGRKKMIIGWSILLVGLPAIGLAAFVVMEGHGLTHDDSITLSRFMWETQQAWPLFFPLIGYVLGAIQWGFTVHILWRWDPTNPNDHRG